MEEHVIPECFFDTVLVKVILNRKKINHQHNCFKVESTLKGIDDFAVGIIDKDKKSIRYLEECNLEIKNENLLLWKHKTKQHYIIQLIPASEQWILNVIKEGNVNIVGLNLPMELDELTYWTKYHLAHEDEDLRNLCKRAKDSNSKTMNTLVNWLTYLFENNRKADINKLKENV